MPQKRSFYKILFENPVPFNMHLRITPQPTVKKIADIFTKRMWQSYPQNISVP